MRSGLEALLARGAPELAERRFALLANQASVTRDYTYAWDALARAPGRLAALLSPQHGLWGTQQANMVETPHARHARLDLPVHSLYYRTRRPDPDLLAGLELLVVDLQDVGVRVFTFAWTLVACLEECARAGVPVLVLDRPNPLGGRRVEGALLEPDCRSFVGGAAIPMRHGLTLGELASLLNAELALGADLEVVPVEGIGRGATFDATGLPWLPPSPNLPTLASVRHYPGQVLVEGTNLSEGRGTTTPFELIGAPFVDPDAWLESLKAFALPGVAFRPIEFRPTFDKWRDETCRGLFLHVTDPDAYRPHRTAVALLAAARALWPRDFAWSRPPYEYDYERTPIDLISGSPRLRERIDAGCRADADLRAIVALDETAWWSRARPHLLYPDDVGGGSAVAPEP